MLCMRWIEYLLSSLCAFRFGPGGNYLETHWLNVWPMIDVNHLSFAGTSAIDRFDAVTCTSNWKSFSCAWFLTWVQQLRYSYNLETLHCEIGQINGPVPRLIHSNWNTFCRFPALDDSGKNEFFNWELERIPACLSRIKLLGLSQGSREVIDARKCFVNYYSAACCEVLKPETSRSLTMMS